MMKGSKISEENMELIQNIKDQKFITDKTLFVENLFHFFEWTKSQLIYFKYIIILQPTSPMRTPKDINSVLDLLRKKTKVSYKYFRIHGKSKCINFLKIKKFNFS